MLNLFREPIGFINSSYAILFHVMVGVCAPFFANYFPDDFGAIPLIVCIVLPLLFFWFFWVLRNHGDNSVSLFAISAFAMLCAAFALISAIKGPLADAEMPVLVTSTLPSIPLLNLFYFSYAESAPVLASIVMYYGAVTYLVSAVLAWILEVIYAHTLDKLMPKKFKRKLDKADLAADRKLFAFFDRNWIMGQNVGALFTLGFLLLFSFLYTATLLLV